MSLLAHSIPQRSECMRRLGWIALAVAVAGVLTGQGVVSFGSTGVLSTKAIQTSAVFDIAVLVLREGLECVLVLAAITAGLVGEQQRFRQTVAVGAGVGLLATVVTWCIAVHILDDISTRVSALQLQAATGLLAVIVLLIVMNWFFHKLYWTGWISLHNRRKRDLMEMRDTRRSSSRLTFGMGLLGFSSFYREGVEVVFFLESYRLRLGNETVYLGVLVGCALSGVIAVLTFFAQRKLPYRRMLVYTGMLLGLVLFVMVGEQAQEMQFAHWLPSTPISWLGTLIPAWMGLWFSIFPTVETLTAQALAVALVLGSYFFAQQPSSNNAG
jgi:high-affinity iron transporter